MKNYDESVKISHNWNWLYIPDHSYRILIISGSGSSKTIVLLNVIKHQQPDIKNSFKLKYQFHINRKEKVGIKKLKNPKALIKKKKSEKKKKSANSV